MRSARQAGPSLGRAFTVRSGGPMNSKLANRLMRKARERPFRDPSSPWFIAKESHALRSITPYALQHAAPAAYLNPGMSPKDAVDRLGHDFKTVRKSGAA